MAIIAGVGASQKADSTEAIQEAYTQAMQPLGGQLPSLLLLFASPTTYDQQVLLNFLKEKAPQAVITGGSSAGEITSVAGSIDKSIALMAIYADKMKFVLGKGENVQVDSKKAGQDLANSIMQGANGEKPKAIIMIPDGLLANGEDIVVGVLDVMGKDFMLAGGSAGDDYTFKGTYEYYGNQILQGSVVGIGLFGDVTFGIGVRHGFMPISAAHTVTKAEGKTIYEIDGKPAFEIYNQYFGKEVEALRAKGEPIASITALYPFGMHAPNKEGYLIRGILNTDDKGVMTLTASIPQGEEVFLMLASEAEAVAAAQDAARQALQRSEGKTIKAIILFNCISRKKILVGKRQNEIDSIRAILGKEIPLIGFYTYGEQAPLGEKIITCSFHNSTDVLFALTE